MEIAPVVDFFPQDSDDEVASMLLPQEVVSTLRYAFRSDRTPDEDLHTRARCLTLPLSGRQGACGGEAKSGRLPVHLEGLVGRHFRLRQQLLKFLPAEINIPQDLRQQPRSN